MEFIVGVKSMSYLRPNPDSPKAKDYSTEWKGYMTLRGTTDMDGLVLPFEAQFTILENKDGALVATADRKRPIAPHLDKQLMVKAANKYMAEISLATCVQEFMATPVTDNKSLFRTFDGEQFVKRLKHSAVAKAEWNIACPGTTPASDAAYTDGMSQSDNMDMPVSNNITWRI